MNETNREDAATHSLDEADGEATHDQRHPSDAASATESETSKQAPGWGALDAAYEDALERLIDEKRAAGLTTDEAVQRIGSRLEEVLNDITERLGQSVFAHLKSEAPALSARLAEDEELLQRNLKEVWGRPDEYFRAVIYSAHETGAAIAASTNNHSKRMQALLASHGRAVRVASEIRHLAMGGYANGATARWRTLYELAVVTSLLKEGDEDIALRYLDYDTIENLKDVESYWRNAAKLGHQNLDRAEEETLKAHEQAARVIARWSPELSKPNGWAFPLFPSKKRVTFSMLAAASGLAHLEPYYLLANNHIHAGAKAARLNMGEPTPEQPPTIGTGPTVRADIAEISHAAMISLNQATAALVVAHLTEGGTPQLDLLVALTAQAAFVQESEALWADAAQQARQRGWFTPTPDD